MTSPTQPSPTSPEPEPEPEPQWDAMRLEDAPIRTRGDQFRLKDDEDRDWWSVNSMLGKPYTQEGFTLYEYRRPRRPHDKPKDWPMSLMPSTPKGVPTRAADAGETRQARCPTCDQQIYVRDDGMFFEHFTVGYPRGNRCEHSGMRAPEASPSTPTADETLRAAAVEMDKQIGILFWTSDDGMIQRSGNPEDKDAPELFCKAWAALRDAIKAAIGATR